MDNEQIEVYRLSMSLMIYCHLESIGLSEEVPVWIKWNDDICNELIELRKQDEINKATIISLKAKVAYLEEMLD